jgi:SHS2 domain-containing protein
VRYPLGRLFRYYEVQPAASLPLLAVRRCGTATGQDASDCGTKVDCFRVLEHTADVGFEAFGTSREELFANAARALMNLEVDLDTVRPSRELTVKAEGSAWPDLLVNWLSEILYLNDAEGWLFHDFSVQELGEKVITATARGEKFDRARHRVKVLVKAVTYHQLGLEETPQGWRAQVYVDI